MSSVVEAGLGARPSPALFADVVGQEMPVAQLVASAASPVHAYLLVGDPGAGPAAAARGFAAALLCPDGGDGTCRHCRLALAGEHPDLAVFSPDGAFLSVRDAAEITRLALRSPVEGERKVIVLNDFERIQVAGPALLKTIEEPPASTVFIVLAAHVPPELVTIASRCVRIDFGPVAASAIVDVLIADGVERSRAETVAASSGGSVERARLLVADDGLDRRRRAWHDVPARLDGTGVMVADLVAELGALIDDSMAALVARQAAEAADLEERIAQYGLRATERKQLEQRHKREQRRHRADELRFGLAVLARRYRDALTAGAGRDVHSALESITAAAEAITRNPNETLLLQSLLLHLPALP